MSDSNPYSNQVQLVIHYCLLLLAPSLGCECRDHSLEAPDQYKVTGLQFNDGVQSSVPLGFYPYVALVTASLWTCNKEKNEEEEGSIPNSHL